MQSLHCKHTIEKTKFTVCFFNGSMFAWNNFHSIFLQVTKSHKASINLMQTSVQLIEKLCSLVASISVCRKGFALKFSLQIKFEQKYESSLDQRFLVLRICTSRHGNSVFNITPSDSQISVITLNCYFSRSLFLFAVANQFENIFFFWTPSH